MGDQVSNYFQIRGDGRWAQGTTSRIGEETMNSKAILEGSLMSHWVREMKKRDRTPRFLVWQLGQQGLER